MLAGKQDWAWNGVDVELANSMTLHEHKLKLTLPRSSQTTALLPLLRIAFLPVDC